MPAVLDQMKDTAYTTVGVNLLVTDAVVDNVRKNRSEMLGRLGDTGERVEKFLEDNEFTAPEFLEEHAAKAREAATETLTDLRARLAPRTDELVDRLPERVGEAVNSSREQMWGFIGIKAPKAPAAKAPAKKVTAKKATAKKAKAAK